MALATLALACTRGPSMLQLDQDLAAAPPNETWLDQGGKARPECWTLTIRQRARRRRGARLEDRAPATSHIRTTAPTPQDVKGPRLPRDRHQDLLDELGAFEDRANGHDLTLVAADGFRQSHPIGFYRRNPLMLAIEGGRHSLVRRRAARLEVLPHSTHPETLEESPEGGAAIRDHHHRWAPRSSPSTSWEERARPRRSLCRRW